MILKLDRYFKPKSQRPLGRNGKPDLDNPESLHLDWLQEDIHALLKGETVDLPRYWDSIEEPDGISIRHSGERIRIREGDILIIDSMFALHDSVLNVLETRCCFKVFINAPQEIRLMRRILREERKREAKAIDVIRDWETLMSAEKRFILPQKPKADFIIDSYVPGYLSNIEGELTTYLFRAEAEAREDSPIRMIQRLKTTMKDDSALYTIDLNHPQAKNLSFVGGKAASLSELAWIPGIHVPEGFVVTTASYDEFIKENNLTKLIEELDRLSD